MKGDRQLLKAVRRLFSRSRVSAERLLERGQEEEVEEVEEYEEEEGKGEEELGAVVDSHLTGLANIRLPRTAIMSGELKKKDYVATRWYRAPELCGSFFSKYTPAIDIWSIGCIFAEILTGKPLFPGKNVVHQLDLMTDLLGTPSPESIAKIRNEKAKRYLSSMQKKLPIPFSQMFHDVDPLALSLLQRLLAFDPKDRPTAEEALSDPYFEGLADVEREPSTHPISKFEFEFERRKLTKEDLRELIYREILEYHPQMLKEYLRGGEQTSFMYPSGVDRFKRQFAHFEEHPGKGERATPVLRQNASLPRERVLPTKEEKADTENDPERLSTAGSVNFNDDSPSKYEHEKASEDFVATENVHKRSTCSPRSLLKSASISASQCVKVEGRMDAKGSTY